LASPVVELLSAVPVPLAVIEAASLRVLALNEPMAEVIKRPLSEIAGLPFSELLPLAHPLADPRPYRQTAEGASYEKLAVVEGRLSRWFIRPLKAEAPSVDYLLLGLLSSGGSSAPDLARLHDINEAKTEFLNMAAHELRTPLGVIHGYGSLLAQGGLSPEHQHLAGQRVFQKARQLSRLIMDMMLVARFDELGPELAKEEVDLVSLLQEIIAEVQRRFPDLAFDLVIRTKSGQTRGNPYWLRLGFRELLDNAIRFRPGPTGRVDISLLESPEGWRLTVIDDGFGIAATDQGRLFQRFSRIETEENSHLVGMVIGLYLVREVAEAHQGRVLVKSQPGVGSEFIFELPRDRQTG
jgi:two-component system phosphate regulon sensor histidine kinase PhoR